MNVLDMPGRIPQLLKLPWPRRLVATVARCLCLLPVLAHAQTTAIPAGEYIRAIGTGTLIVAPVSRGGQQFSRGRSASTSIAARWRARVRNLRAELETAKGEPPCLVEFEAIGANVTVTPSFRLALFLRRARGFRGTYGKAPPGCTGKEVQSARTAFKQAYDNKDYARAQARLAPLLASCSNTLYETDEADIRNDLAVTLYHLGKPAECRDVLKDVEYLADLSDKEINGQYPPSDADARVAIAHAARTNLKLCGGGRNK